MAQPQPVPRVRRAEDPLAELARLIGQEDPFADFVTNRPADARAGTQRRPQQRDTRSQHDLRAAPSRRPAPTRLSDPFESDHTESETSRPAGRSTYAYGGSRTPRADEIPQMPRSAARALPRTDLGRQSPAFGDDEDEGLFEDRPQHARDEVRHARRGHVQPADDVHAYADENYDPDYDDEAYLPAHGDEFYDEAPRRRLKGWMLIGIAAIGAIAVGTSGLFAYRAIFPGSDSSAPPKMIRSEKGPTKVAPPASQTADNKRIQDRVGAPATGSTERIVSREEKPIDQSRIPQSSSQERIPSGTVTAAQPFASPAGQVSAGPATATPVSTEPRRVRTVTVRADGTIAPSANRPAPTAAAPRSGQVSNEPMALQGGSGAAVMPPPRPAAGAAPAARQGDNPWATLSTASSGSAPTQQASLPPPPPNMPAPVNTPATPIVAVQTPPPAGSYVVQVAAQKSEAEAQASWQSLQQRYSTVLAGQQAAIRRVDLGERGVFYRAQVGPFSSRAQASEVCQSLKAAGGECVIQRN
jgi:hypothetical protein